MPITSCDYEQIISVVQRSYPIEVDSISLHRDMIGYVFIVASGPKKYVLKVYRQFNASQAKQAIGIMTYLQAIGYPVAPVVPTIDNLTHVLVSLAEGMCIGVLFEFVEGLEPDVKSELEVIGQQVGRLHAVMSRYPSALVSYGKEYFIDRFLQTLEELDYPSVRIRDLAHFGKELWGSMEQLPTGFCHGDLHSGNMFKIDSGEYVLFDFDVASRTSSVIDIATLCDCTNFNVFNESTYDATSEAIDRFVSGYKAVHYISDYELRAVHDFIAIRHYELIANIGACQGLNASNILFLDKQYNWLMSWRELCAQKQKI